MCSLGFNQISDVGMAAFADELECNTTLTSLEYVIVTVFHGGQAGLGGYTSIQNSFRVFDVFFLRTGFFLGFKWAVIELKNSDLFDYNSS